MGRKWFVVFGAFGYGYAVACCGVSPSGQPVKFGDQSNIIVWNPETKTEHFVRNAFFDSNSKDFGFIAPTPTMPELETTDGRAFEVLARLEPVKPGTEAGSITATTASLDGPEVLQEVQVGKYEATTLRSTDESAIADYLKRHGYQTSKDFEEWASHYARKGWVLTAFKVRKKFENFSETGIIRMSFKTDKPFNPYYVPENNRSKSGILKIYFVSNGTYSARVGDGEKWNRKYWNASMPDSSVTEVAASLKLSPGDFPKNPTVTFFRMDGWLAGSTEDLFFTKDSLVGPIIAVPILATLGCGMWFFTRSRKAKVLSS